MLLERSPVKNQNVAETERHLALQEIDKPRDECGVFAMYAPDDFEIGDVVWRAGELGEHRGNSGSGMAVIDPETLMTVIAKGIGRLREAIPQMNPMQGKTPANVVRRARKFIIHNRYTTSKSNRVEAVQPFIVDKSTEDELVLGHNGHLDKHPIKGIDALAVKYGIDPKTAESDSHMLALVLSASLRDAKYRAGGAKLSTPKVGLEMSKVLAQVNGSYCLTMFYDGKVIGARDPWGVHLMSLGIFKGGKRGAFASETVMLEPLKERGALESIRDVKPGELAIIDDEGIKSYRIPRRMLKKHCMFEHIYTADERSVANGSHVGTARYNMGKLLAENDPVGADMVVGVPSTGLPIAEGYANSSGVPKVDAIIKNPNAPRTFHLRGEERTRALKEKFTIDAEAIDGKSLIVIDDSTIKGNTARQLIQQLRDAGAREVHFRFASPPYISSCNRGMDTSELDELVARGRTNKEIAKELGADSVGYNTVQAIEKSIDEARVDITVESAVGNLCMACTTGDYSDGIVPARVEEERRQNAAIRAGQLVGA